MSWGSRSNSDVTRPSAGFSALGPLPSAAHPAGSVARPSPQFVARYFDLLAEPQAATGSLAALLAKEPQAEIAALLEKLPPHYRQALDARLSRGQRDEWLALAAESDPALFYEQALGIQRHLQDGGKDAAGMALLQLLLEPGLGLAGKAPQVFAKAQRELDAAMGRGAFGARAEFLSRRFFQEAADPTMLVGFGVASLAYKTVRLATLARLLGSPAAGSLRAGAFARLLASGAGLAAETPTFVFTTKLGRELSGTPQDWSATEVGHELAATGLTLFCLKGTAALSAGAFNAVNRLDPTLAVLSAGSFTRFSQRAIPQAGMFAGIVLSRKVEESLGLRPKLDDATLLLDSLSTYFQFQVGGSLAEGVLGRGYQRLQRELELRAALASTPLPPPYVSGPGLAPALAAAGSGAASSIEELTGKPLLMAQHDGGEGGGKPGGKVVELRPGEPRAEDANPPPRRDTPSNPADYAKEMRRKVGEERQRLISVMNAIRAFSAQVQVVLAHAERGRSRSPQLKELQAGLVTAYDRFLEKYRETDRQREALLPLVVRDPALQQEIGNLRSDHLRFLKNAVIVHEQVEGIFQQIAIGDPAGIQRALRGLHDRIPELLGREANWLPAVERPLAQEVLFAKLSGMLRGVWMKDAYRGTPEETALLREHGFQPWGLLDRDSARADDYKLPEWLLSELRHPHPSDWDLAESLLVRLYPTQAELRDDLAREVSPREALRWGGTYADPFRTWLGVQVPTLLAAAQGNPQAFAEKIRGLEVFMEPETREATRLAAWWLGRAVSASGEPRDWAEERESGGISRRALRLSFDPEVNRERAERELGARGDVATVGHALLAFLKHPYDARASLEAALESPAPIREDVVSLTGALQGAFHGQAAFHPEWSTQVIFQGVPGRHFEAATRQVVDFANQEMQQRHAVENLDALVFGNGKNGKVMPLRSVSAAARGGLPGALAAGFTERFTNAELVAVGAVWDTAVTLALEARESIPAEEWRDFRKALRDSVRRMDAAVKSLQEFRRRVRAGSGKAAAENSTADWEDIHAQIARLEATLGDMKELQSITATVQAGRKFARMDADTYDKMRELTLQLIDRWEMPALASLKANPEIDLDGIRSLQSGALLLGRSRPGPVLTPLFENRSDEDTGRALLQAYAELGGRFPPGSEVLMELYLQVVGSGYFIREGRSLADLISPSALFTVMTPAYLEANRSNPTRALRELLTLRSAESPEFREGWRIATYVALRLLEGAQPGSDLLHELRLSFANSTMAQGLDDLARIHEGGDSFFRQGTLRRWDASNDMRSRVLLGLHAFFLSSGDAKGALKAVAFSAIDPHQVAERVAGMLAEAHRSQIPLARSPVEVLKFDLPKDGQGNDALPNSMRTPMVEKDIAETLGNAFIPEVQANKVEAFWQQWAGQLGVTIPPREREVFRKNLRNLPGYFYQTLAYYVVSNPLLAKVLMVELGILPTQASVTADLALQAALSTKARDAFSAEDWQGHTNGILFSYRTVAKHYFPKTYQPLGEAERREWHGRIGELPAVVVEALNAGGLQSANLLLLMDRFGLSKLGTPAYDQIPED